MLYKEKDKKGMDNYTGISVDSSIRKTSNAPIRNVLQDKTEHEQLLKEMKRIQPTTYLYSAT